MVESGRNTIWSCLFVWQFSQCRWTHSTNTPHAIHHKQNTHTTKQLSLEQKRPNMGTEPGIQALPTTKKNCHITNNHATVIQNWRFGMTNSRNPRTACILRLSSVGCVQTLMHNWVHTWNTMDTMRTQCNDKLICFSCRSLEQKNSIEQ